MKHRYNRGEGPFAIVPTWVQRATRGLPGAGTALSVYTILAAASNYETGAVSMTRKAIAQGLGEKTTDTVDRAIKTLTQAGALIVRKRRDAEHGNLANEYIVLRSPAEHSRPASQQNAARASRKSAATTISNSSKSKRDTDKIDSEVERVWLHWLKLKPQARICPERAIARRLKSGGGRFTADELMAVATFLSTAEWYSEHLWPKIDAAWLYDSDAKVDKYRMMAESGVPSPKQSTASVGGYSNGKDQAEGFVGTRVYWQDSIAFRRRQ